MGKTIRCPVCKAFIPPESEPRSAASDAENAEPDAPSPSRAVKTTPSPRTVSTPSRDRPPSEEEPEEDIESAIEKPFLEKSSRKKRSIRKKSSAGLIIGLAAGGVVLLLLVLGTGAGLLWYFVRNKAIPEAEWQPCSPPNCGCTVLMPGAPVPQTMNILGLTMNQYQVERKKENAAFALAFFDVPPQALRPNILEDIANSSREGAQARMNGSTVSSQTSITLGNLPGREYQLKMPTRGTFITRIYLAKVGDTHRVYVVMAGGDNIQPNTGDAVRFFDSFKIDASALPPSFDGAAGQGGAQPPPGVNPPPPNLPSNSPRTPPRSRPPQGPRRGR